MSRALGALALAFLLASCGGAPAPARAAASAGTPERPHETATAQAPKAPPAQAATQAAHPVRSRFSRTGHFSGCGDAADCETRCRAAHGKSDDCVELAWRKMGARGTRLDDAGAQRLLAPACAANAAGACGLAAWIEVNHGANLPPARRAVLAQACGRGDGWSCAALVNWALLPAPGAGGSRRDVERGARWAETGCRAGHVWCCNVVDSLLDQVPVADRQTARYTELTRLVADTLVPACRGGRREACDRDGPRYAALARRDCAAGDHGACAEVVSFTRDPAERARLADDACDQGGLLSSCGMVCDSLRDGTTGQPDLAAARACYQRACSAGLSPACTRADDPLLGGGCPVIDESDQPHLSLQSLPRLELARPDGAAFDSRAAHHRRARLYVFTATWYPRVPLASLAALARKLSAGPGATEVVAVLSNDHWDDLSPDDRTALTGVPGLVVTLDPPGKGAVETTGPATRGLGISKIPEALLVDARGRVRRHLVGDGLFRDPLNTRRCIDTTLGKAPHR